MKNKAILSSILALALIGACKSPTTIVENSDVGIIQGKVALFANCDSVSDASGATVSIEGTGFSATTNSLGDWTMNNVPAGIYNILITKPGFDTDLIAQDQFSGAGTQFFENGSISSMTPILDSVSILSIQVTRRDSTDVGDSILDTVAHIYSLNITFTMNGPDPTISFYPTFRDLSRANNNNFNEFRDSLRVATPISRNQSEVGTGTIYSRLWAFPQDIYLNGSPQPGDTILVSTTPYTNCYGRSAIILSKTFVLP